MVFKPLRPYARAISPLITSAQILQMAVGSSVTIRSATLYYQGYKMGQQCAVDPANFKLGRAPQPTTDW